MEILGDNTLRFLFAFVVVLCLIGLTTWLVRRFAPDRLGGANQRGRQPRLAVIDAAAVDGRRRLILIRRDNVEHLLMIGGPTDVVVEANIVRAAPAQRETTPTRPPSAPEPLPRAAPLGDSNMWPLQPEPAPVPQPRQLRQPAPPPHADEPVQWHAEPEPPPLPPRQPRPEPRPDLRPEPRQAVDPLAGLAAELSRHQPEPPPRPVRERAPQPAPPSDPQFASSADQNLAEMAQRLEAALRRPGAKAETRAEPKPRPAPPPPAPAPPQSAPAPDMEAAPAPVLPEPKPVRSEAKPAREPKAAPQGKNLYDSLEQEMASLLGRPNKT